MRHSHPYFKQFHEQLDTASNREERLRILQQTRKHAGEEFPVQLDKLEKLLLTYNPLIILGTFSFCNLCYLPKEGHEINASAPILIGQPHVELVQALILCHYEQEFQCKPITIPEFQELSDLVGYVVCLHRVKDMPDYDIGLSDEEIGKLHFRSMLKDHTELVRNWGYFEQVVRVVKKLFEPLEDDIEKELGIRIYWVIEMFVRQYKAIEQRLQKHSDKLQSVMRQKTVEAAVETFRTEFNDTGLQAEKFKALLENPGWTFEHMQLMLLHRANHFVWEVFTFDLAEFIGSFPSTADTSKIEQLLSQLAFYPGDLRACKREHLFLDNSIWIKPIMWATPKVLFLPIPGLFQSFCFEMMEALVFQSPVLKEKYLERRAVFLEEYTAQLFQRKFSGGQYFPGSEWKNPSTKQEGENDLLIVFDSVALVVEAKSGAINPVARRGGPSIAQEINELLIDPARQGQEFAALLRENSAQHSFKTKAGTTNLVDSTKIKQFVCLSITLERFGPLAAQIPKLQTAGLAKREIPAMPAMSLADLEIALEFLESPFQLVHYLTRRAAFELRHEFVGDELDLLVLYLRTGFAEKTIPDPQNPLFIAGLSKSLDRFFLNSPENPVFEKPKRALSKWWMEILAELEKKATHRRYEIGCILLDMPDEEQQIFEKRFEERCAKVRKIDPFTLESVEAMWTPVKSEVSNAVLIAAPIREQVVPQRYFIVEQLVKQAIAETGAEQALVILVDADHGPWPYSGMYLLDKR